MPVSKEKDDHIQSVMRQLGIQDDDLLEKFIIGQNLHKTSSCVYLQHIPTGISVKCQASRSREMNRYFARRLLCEKYQSLILKEKTEKQQESEKIRRQKRTRSRKQKKKILEGKRLHGEKKGLRSRPDEN